MRINVYGEELTDETEVVRKVVTDDEHGARAFYGIRMFLASPDVLHYSAEDDDRSAITLWVPWTQVIGNNFAAVRDVLESLQSMLSVAEMADRLAAGVEVDSDG